MRYGPSGHALLFPEDVGPAGADALADGLCAAGYDEEFCLSPSFEPSFVAALMHAGFLVMSAQASGAQGVDQSLLLPKLHLRRSVLFFRDLHEPRSIRPRLGLYALRADEDFDAVLEGCVRIHGDEWLTGRLRDCLSLLRTGGAGAYPVRLRSFGLYRDGRLVAGEFGVSAGGAYTSYSGYYDEDSAGTVQLILTARMLRDAGYALWDLGMPLPYKERLGAQVLERADFITFFRSARDSRSGPPVLPPSLSAANIPH